MSYPFPPKYTATCGFTVRTNKDSAQETCTNPHYEDARC